MEGLLAYFAVMAVFAGLCLMVRASCIAEENRKMAKRKEEMEMMAGNPEVFRYLVEKEEKKQKAQKEMQERVWGGVMKGGAVAASAGGNLLGRILKK
jgi:hypothetical protein